MAEEKDIKGQYAELMKKYKLPDFDELEHNFEISGVEDNDLLRGIRHKMSEKLEHYAKLLEDYIQPDSSFSSMYEIKDFDEKHKQKVIALFRKLMVPYRECVKLNLNLGEEKDAKFIIEFSTAWKEMKPELAELIDFAKRSWQTQDKEDNFKSYFG